MRLVAIPGSARGTHFQQTPSNESQWTPTPWRGEKGSLAMDWDVLFGETVMRHGFSWHRPSWNSPRVSPAC